MRAYDILARKRDGCVLTREEIFFLVDGFTKGSIPDYQMSAFAMAVFFRGLNARETSDLTLAMVESGVKVDLSGLPGKKLDKHSTGGVGDKTSLVLIPLVAGAGVTVAKMSGRGLGHTGGTIDKLECIPGFKTQLTMAEFLEAAKKVGAAIVGQTGGLVPADKKLYALRDTTATVNSIPLIASSVMSKKIAAGSDGVLLDVKVGSGAFMKTVEDARGLARLMVDIGTQAALPVTAVLSSMEQPLGFAVGNAVELSEALEVLHGRGPEDLRELCLDLGREMLLLAGDGREPEEIREALQRLLDRGGALEKFAQMVEAQNGDSSVVNNPGRLAKASIEHQVPAAKEGYIVKIDAEQIGAASMRLGAGRAVKEDKIDPAAGIILKKKLGQSVRAGEPMAVLYTNDAGAIQDAADAVAAAFTLGVEPKRPGELVMETISNRLKTGERTQ